MTIFKTMILSEEDECMYLANYLRGLVMQERIQLFTHVPNSTYTQSWQAKTKNKSMGVARGVPDYIVVTDKEVIFIEMKRIKGGVVSEEQDMWITSLQGKTTKAMVCRGFQEAKKRIEELI